VLGPPVAALVHLDAGHQRVRSVATLPTTDPEGDRAERLGVDVLVGVGELDTEPLVRAGEP
jgi:hypothetical protein